MKKVILLAVAVVFAVNCAMAQEVGSINPAVDNTQSVAGTINPAPDKTQVAVGTINPAPDTAKAIVLEKSVSGTSSSRVDSISVQEAKILFQSSIENSRNKAEHEKLSRELEIATENLRRLNSRPASNEREVLIREQVKIINKTLHKTRVIRQDLSPTSAVAMLAKLGYVGPADKWAKPYVDEARARGLVVGDSKNFSSQSSSAKMPMSRQDVAVSLLRHDDNPGAHKVAIDSAIISHDMSSNAHSGLLDPMRRNSLLGAIAFWGLIAVIIGLLIWTLTRPRDVYSRCPRGFKVHRG